MTYRVTWEAFDPHKRKDAEKINVHLNERGKEGWTLVNATTAPIGWDAPLLDLPRCLVSATRRRGRTQKHITR